MTLSIPMVVRVGAEATAVAWEAEVVSVAAAAEWPAEAAPVAESAAPVGAAAE
jgi:hypothetical protein